MGRVWLCEEVTAEHPFYLEEEKVNLYSFEELCYYLYQNTGVLEESFFNERLCFWLAQDVGQAELSRQLRQGIEQERSGCWCMEQILKAGGFYSSEELKQVLKTAERMEQKTPLERAKLRGDRLLRAEKYRDAISEYRRILEQAGSDDDPVPGLIWHNMGTAYVRQMLFAPAAECYETAYGISKREESREAYLLALACRDGKTITGEADSLAEARQQLRELKQAGNRAGYEKQLERLLQNFRSEYRKSE